MQKLMMLTVVAIMTAGLTGCNWFNRGAECNTCAPGMGGGYTAGYGGGESYMAPPAVQMQPGATYLPGPGQ